MFCSTSEISVIIDRVNRVKFFLMLSDLDFWLFICLLNKFDDNSLGEMFVSRAIRPRNIRSTKCPETLKSANGDVVRRDSKSIVTIGV